MLSANAATHKRDHPPAVQPRHRQVARAAVWHRARRPGARLRLRQAGRLAGLQVAGHRPGG
eukprot:7221415-Pyramimonas_sp.AAC.1